MQNCARNYCWISRFLKSLVNDFFDDHILMFTISNEGRKRINMHCLILLLLFSSCTFAQAENLDSFLDKAQKATTIYRETFKNLVAEELRTYEYYRKDETLEDTRKIKSMFIVYPSTKDNSVAEYRNVIEFNGKNVARDEDDIVKFFGKLTKSSSSEEEFSRLAKEANRFDGKSHAYGLTLGQAPILQPFYRPFFEFRIVGKEKIEGRDVIIVAYKQTKSTLRIKANPTAEEIKQEPSGISFDAFLPANFRPTNPRLEGKLWLDAETAQLWRDEFSVTIQPAFLSKPVVSANFVYEYQSSEFGILLPKKLWMLTNRFAGSNEQTMVVTKAAQKTFEYTKFSQPSAEGKDVILKK